MIRLITLLILLTSIYSCDHCKCVSSFGLRLGLAAFQPTDIDTIIVRKFEKGNNFNHLLDTVQWDRSNVMFEVQSDTFEMGSWNEIQLLRSQYDYKIYIPSINKTYQITDMNEPQIEGNCRGKVGCANQIVSCNVDGNFVSTTSPSETLLLKK